MSGIPFLPAEDLSGLIDEQDAITALERALRRAGSTEHTPLRTRTDLPEGHLLYMPAQVGDVVGVKIASVAPGNAARGLPRIQGVMLLSDAVTLQPLALLDASAFTVLRTASVSAVAVRRLAPEDASHLVVFGAGPQALGHVRALAAVRPLEHVTVVGRSPERAGALVGRIRDLGLPAAPGTLEDVASADLVACCTSAETPLFDSTLLPPLATVAAIGSHSPRAREVDTALIRRATVVVESRASAFAEAGDVVLACADGVPEEEAVDLEITDLVAGAQIEPDRPRLFKGVGEAWADVVVARLAVERLGLLTPEDSAPAGP